MEWEECTLLHAYYKAIDYLLIPQCDCALFLCSMTKFSCHRRQKERKLLDPSPISRVLAACLLLAACCLLLAACCLLAKPVRSILDTKEGYKTKASSTSSVNRNA